MLTPTQLVTLKTALLAEQDVNVIAAVAQRNDTFLTDWCNSPSTQDAWTEQVSGTVLFELTSVASFDNLTAGKRDAWRLLLDFAPVNATKQKIRKAVQDIWGNVDSIPILQGMTQKASKGQVYLGGTVVTTNTVSATKLDYSGVFSTEDIGSALNG